MYLGGLKKHRSLLLCGWCIQHETSVGIGSTTNSNLMGKKKPDLNGVQLRTWSTRQALVH
ncbi:hypothetical protein D9613_003227 [Agrocybe pediades]|uniref:Uncharacterized protein n=1 Tax=Agrocybe pediades TaxID=84607 RepID=A0A8H4QQH1_9AGAR|nr:hypothetical protein D9613_003227 [Agrocybe pediades]